MSGIKDAKKKRARRRRKRQIQRIPVSYTHLDVYKRQLLYHGAVGCVRSVKDCPTAYRLRLVP